ncbi:MAG: saccharopine dehydrogenase C-terminal domain-containing protein [Bacteroidales bacterium]
MSNPSNILVLGAGLVGQAMALDMHRNGHRVVVADRDPQALEGLKNRGLDLRETDFESPRLDDLLSRADLVIGAAPGALGYRLMERVIDAGRNLVDISFCPEDFMDLDRKARDRGLCVVADMGVAPGMCNALLGFHDAHMEVESYRCLVGGLPFRREWPLEYKSSWSPMDCLEEYIRPARFRVDGEDVVREALSDQERVDCGPAGILEAWNSDGLRSLLSSFPHIPNLVEKTLRYPGTVDYLRVLRTLGYFSTDPVEVGPQSIRPIDLTAALLFPRFRLEPGEGEFTYMMVEIRGREKGQPAGYRYSLYDEYHRESDTLSMARCTGYTCTGVASMVLDGTLKETGVLPPERVATTQDRIDILLNYLADRGVRYAKEAI